MWFQKANDEQFKNQIERESSSVRLCRERGKRYVLQVKFFCVYVFTSSCIVKGRSYGRKKIVNVWKVLRNG